MRPDVVAVHEAAHAVVTYRTVDHVGGHVSIVHREDRHGEAQDEYSQPLDDADHAEAAVLSCYAGGHAQRRLDAALGEYGCGRDDDVAATLLRRWGWTARETELRARALDLVHQHWTEIVAVAAELERVQVLEETEVELLIEAATGDVDASRALEWWRAGADWLPSWRAQHIAGDND